MDNLAMNVARFANSVAKVMDVDARTVEVLELIRAGESESRSSKSSVKVVFIKFGILSRTLSKRRKKETDWRGYRRMRLSRLYAKVDWKT